VPRSESKRPIAFSFPFGPGLFSWACMCIGPSVSKPNLVIILLLRMLSRHSLDIVHWALSVLKRPKVKGTDYSGSRLMNTRTPRYRIGRVIKRKECALGRTVISSPAFVEVYSKLCKIPETDEYTNTKISDWESPKTQRMCIGPDCYILTCFDV